MRYAQFHVQRRLEDDEAKAWRHHAHALSENLEARVRERGFEPVEAPPVPNDDVIACEITDPFRVLYFWIPVGAWHPDAGYYAIRVDTLAEKRR